MTKITSAHSYSVDWQVLTGNCMTLYHHTIYCIKIDLPQEICTGSEDMWESKASIQRGRRENNKTVGPGKGYYVNICYRWSTSFVYFTALGEGERQWWGTTGKSDCGEVAAFFMFSVICRHSQTSNQQQKTSPGCTGQFV